MLGKILGGIVSGVISGMVTTKVTKEALVYLEFQPIELVEYKRAMKKAQKAMDIDRSEVEPDDV